MWLAKNNPNWEKYMKDFEDLSPDPNDPDPEEHALQGGDMEAVENMMCSWFSTLAEIDHRVNVLMREVSHLIKAMENLRASQNTTTGSPENNGEGSLRFPEGTSNPSDLPPTSEQ